jgi:hypothetical protein
MLSFLFRFTLVLYSVLFRKLLAFEFLLRYLGDFALFEVCSSCKNVPSARRASAANVVCRDVDMCIRGQELST